MHLFTDLWLPVVLSSVLVFVASSILHMVLPIHHDDYGKVPGESDIMKSIRAQNVPPGTYMFPRPASVKDMGSEEMLAKYREGPVGFMTVLPDGVPAMGKNLVLWFIYSLVVSCFTGYAAMLSLEPGMAGMTVFRLTVTVALAAYALGTVPDSIWKGVGWKVTMKFIGDGVVYALVTAACFTLLWPAAS